MTAGAPASGVAAPQPPPTERRNPRTRDIDRLSTAEILKLINDEDAGVPAAVAAVRDSLTRLVDAAVVALHAGRRVHYFGAGTSGRLGILDAVELRPTYNIPESWFCPHLAGGPEAVWRAVEGAEDDRAAGAAEATGCVRSGDVAVGLAASGRTPYVLGALDAACAAGATTALITADPHTPAAAAVDVFLGLDTGPEVITGSTRMKAATAQKLVLNAFSTAVMVRLGRVYSNLMVSVVAGNAKLRGRVLSILIEATGCAEPACRRALDDADGDVRVALVALLSGAGGQAARRALAASGGQVAPAVRALAAEA